jgi:hypothetical protein
VFQPAPSAELLDLLWTVSCKLVDHCAHRHVHQQLEEQQGSDTQTDSNHPRVLWIEPTEVTEAAYNIATAPQQNPLSGRILFIDLLFYPNNAIFFGNFRIYHLYLKLVYTHQNQ